MPSSRAVTKHRSDQRKCYYNIHVEGTKVHIEGTKVHGEVTIVQASKRGDSVHVIVIIMITNVVVDGLTQLNGLTRKNVEKRIVSNFDASIVRI